MSKQKSKIEQLEELEKKEVVLPDYEYEMQTAHIHKDHVFAYPELGSKIVKKETAYDDIIGSSPSTCKKLYGLGLTIQSITRNGKSLDFGLNEYSNHVWIPQINKKYVAPNGLIDPVKKILYVCINCGSMSINGKFYNYFEVERDEKKKKEQVG